MALKLLSHRRQLQHLSTRELERKAQEVLGDPESSRLELELQKRDYQFLNYAKARWIDHVTGINPDSDNMMWGLFCRCVEGDNILANRPWESTQQAYGKSNDIPKAVRWLLAHNHYTLLLYHARHQSHLFTEEVKREILHNAIVNDNYNFTDLIIQQGNNSARTLSCGLLYASREGCSKTLTALLRAGADVNSRVYDQTALQAAAEGGHLEIVERLLAAKSDVNTPAADQSGGTALQVAAEGGHLEIVERLLAARADVDAPAANYDGRTALQAAAEGGHLEVVQRLLAAKADVNAPATAVQLRGSVRWSRDEG